MQLIFLKCGVANLVTYQATRRTFATNLFQGNAAVRMVVCLMVPSSKTWLQPSNSQPSC